MYDGIRNCWIFLNNIDKTVPVKWTQEEFEKNKKQWIGRSIFPNRVLSPLPNAGIWASGDIRPIIGFGCPSGRNDADSPSL